MVKNTVGSGRNARTMKKAPWWVSGRGVVTTNCVIILVFAKMIVNLLTWGVTKLIGMAYFWFQRISNHTALRHVTALYKWNNQSFSLFM